MSSISHQTVRLTRGRHQGPDQGACVMELASMLAGEPFSDHPSSTCPVIGAFLRAYNDGLPDDRRQDLYEYAAKVVGTQRLPPGPARAGAHVPRMARRADARAWPARPGCRSCMAGWSLGSVGRAAARAARTSSESHKSVLRAGRRG